MFAHDFRGLWFITAWMGIWAAPIFGPKFEEKKRKLGKKRGARWNQKQNHGRIWPNMFQTFHPFDQNQYIRGWRNRMDWCRLEFVFVEESLRTRKMGPGAKKWAEKGWMDAPWCRFWIALAIDNAMALCWVGRMQSIPFPIGQNEMGPIGQGRHPSTFFLFLSVPLWFHPSIPYPPKFSPLALKNANSFSRKNKMFIPKEPTEGHAAPSSSHPLTTQSNPTQSNRKRLRKACWLLPSPSPSLQWWPHSPVYFIYSFKIECLSYFLFILANFWLSKKS